MMAPPAILLSRYLFVAVLASHHTAAALADFEKACSLGSGSGCKSVKAPTNSK
ncbi:MAG: hypothetical protein HGA43_09480 [Nitrospirae bacterium]|nr:hypothetical protein [Nitrospirota bacterium]